MLALSIQQNSQNRQLKQDDVQLTACVGEQLRRIALSIVVTA